MVPWSEGLKPRRLRGSEVDDGLGTHGLHFAAAAVLGPTARRRRPTVLEALDFVCHDGEREVPKISLTEALATLQALPEVEVAAYASYGEQINKPLYATKEPS